MEGVFQDLNSDKYSERSHRVTNLKEFFGIDFDKSYEISLTKMNVRTYCFAFAILSITFARL